MHQDRRGPSREHAQRGWRSPRAARRRRVEIQTGPEDRQLETPFWLDDQLSALAGQLLPTPSGLMDISGRGLGDAGVATAAEHRAAGAAERAGRATAHGTVTGSGGAGAPDRAVVPRRAEPRRHGPWLRDVTRCRTEIVREPTREAQRLEIQPWDAPQRTERGKSSKQCRRVLGRPSPAGTLRHRFLPRRAVPDAHRARNSLPRSCQLSSIFSACRCQTRGLWSSSVSMVSTRSTMMS